MDKFLRIAVESDVGVVDSIFAECITDPFAGHCRRHEWNDVAHSTRELKHDNHQSH